MRNTKPSFTQLLEQYVLAVANSCIDLADQDGAATFDWTLS